MTQALQHTGDLAPGDAGRRRDRRGFLDAHARPAHGVVRVQDGFLEIHRRKPADQRADFPRALAEERVHRGGHRVVLHAPGLARARHRELGVHSGKDGVFAEQAGAETVHGRNPGPLQRRADGVVVVKGIRQLLAHVAGGFLGERDRQDAERVHAGRDQALEIFHQHGGLTGTGAGHHAGVELAVFDIDGGKLACCELDRAHASSASATGASACAGS